MVYLRLASVSVLILCLAACGKSGTEAKGKGEGESAAPATALKATSDTGEKPAGVELRGKDLIAWKLAYHAAERSVLPSPMGASLGAKTTVVPELPRRRLMELTPTGDRKFTFGVEFHDPSQRDKDYWSLYVVTVLVVDLETSMRERIVDCSNLPATQKTLDDYAKQFGETDGVRACRAEVAPNAVPSPAHPE